MASLRTNRTALWIGIAIVAIVIVVAIVYLGVAVASSAKTTIPLILVGDQGGAAS
jgi:hypothetical protein